MRNSCRKVDYRSLVRAILVMVVIFVLFARFMQSVEGFIFVVILAVTFGYAVYNRLPSGDI